MKDITVICDCGKTMHKIEDGREQHTKRRFSAYPENSMEFACSCGKAVDVTWSEYKLEKVE